MSKKNILFVDDEPNVLQGLQRMLRSMRNEWDIATAGGGEEALAMLAKEAFDVIVTDMRMPDMDGAQLLQEVMKTYPQIVRIVLSGQSDQESVFRAIGPTHQYLSKPCDTVTLKATVDRACTLHEVLKNDILRQIISKLQSIPSLPSLYTEIMKEIRSDEPSIEKIGRIIAKDVGMTAKILQIVNSAFFGFYNNVQDPTRAITILGLDKVRSLVLTIHIFTEFKQEYLNRFKVSELWEHNLHVGECAKELAVLEKKDKQFIDECYMAGLLHDSGKMVLMANLPDDYIKVLATAKESHCTIGAAEKNIIGATHDQVGAYLLGLWGLPTPILEAVLYHHYPTQCVHTEIVPLAFVHAANALVRKIRPAPEGENDTLDEAYMEAIGFQDKIEKWTTCCANLLEKDDLHD